MPSFQFELVSPERLLFAGEVDSVVVPASEGQITVLKDHAPFMSTMKPGVVEVSDGARTQRLFVRGGFADVSSRGLTILAEQAVPVEELDLAAIDAEIKNAEEDFNDARTDDARRVASEKLSQLHEVKAALGL
jgi:F-type H+-transporting ATPase subunit epsilon